MAVPGWNRTTFDGWMRLFSRYPLLVFLSGVVGMLFHFMFFWQKTLDPEQHSWLLPLSNYGPVGSIADGLIGLALWGFLLGRMQTREKRAEACVLPLFFGVFCFSLLEGTGRLAVAVIRALL